MAPSDRNLWIARNLLPNEARLRAALARWNLPPELEADDIVQEVYGRLASRATLADIIHPRAYMIETARRIILMHLRRSRVVSIRAG